MKNGAGNGGDSRYFPQPGDSVKITDGPFEDFAGTIARTDPDSQKLRVDAMFFGREVPLELDFLQVERL
jgi:transcriptional antiterminator NusG